MEKFQNDFPSFAAFIYRDADEYTCPARNPMCFRVRQLAAHSKRHFSEGPIARFLFFLGNAEPRVRIISSMEPLSPAKMTDCEFRSPFKGCGLLIHRNGTKLYYLPMLATSNYSSGDILK
jgi:hypothetical protein